MCHKANWPDSTRTTRTVIISCLGWLLASSAWAQHDPGRNAVRLLAKGKVDKGAAEVFRKQGRMNSPSDRAEQYFVKTMAACLRGKPDRAFAHAREAVAQGLPMERLLAGPRDVLDPLYRYPAFAEWSDQRAGELLHGPLLGSVTDHSARFWVRTASSAEIVVQVDTGEGPLSFRASTSPERDFTATVEATGLAPDTLHTYRVMVDGNPATEGSFRTHPEQGRPGQFMVGFGGGAGYTPKYERMWNTIAGQTLSAFLLLGDNVYIDDPTHSMTHRYCYYRRQSRPEWRHFSQGTPIYAIYDDHDFGENDCIPGPETETPHWKRKVWDVFRENWNNPSYGGGEKQPGCWFDFTIANVHFILLDGRYYRDLKGASMLGPIQKQWLFKTLKNSKSRFKVLASPVPWASGVKPGSNDTWDGFPDEREEIFSFLEKHRIDGVLLMSADRHRTDLRRIPRPNGHDLYEVMSSRLTNVHTHPLQEIAKGSIFIAGYNEKCSFGTLAFDTTKPDPEVVFRIINIDGEEIYAHPLTWAQFQYRQE